MNKKDSLASRMKRYEKVPKTWLTLNQPKVIRLDMRAGHTFCKKLKRPFDDIFSNCIIESAKELCKQIPGTVMAYTQSDEISIIINDTTDKYENNCFFEGNVEKMVSISASIVTIAFNKKYMEEIEKLKENESESFDLYSENLWKAQFDSRVFCLPSVQELHNYILWRQQDATRNSIQMVGHANFTQKELHKKNGSEIQEMLFQKKQINWNDIPTKYKRGCAIVKKEINILSTQKDLNNTTETKRKRYEEIDIPILTQDTEFISNIYENRIYK